jgi:hypothetical protein
MPSRSPLTRCGPNRARETTNTNLGGNCIGPGYHNSLYCRRKRRARALRPDSSAARAGLGDSLIKFPIMAERYRKEPRETDFLIDSIDNVIF